MVYISILSSQLICILPFAAGDVTDLGGSVETGAVAKGCGAQTNALTQAHRYANEHTGARWHTEANNSHF